MNYKDSASCCLLFIEIKHTTHVTYTPIGLGFDWKKPTMTALSENEGQSAAEKRAKEMGLNTEKKYNKKRK